MRKGITISVSASNRQRLEAIVSDRNTSQKYAWRSRIILLTGAGVGTNGIMAATGKSKTTVWRWQERFAEAGVEGLLRQSYWLEHAEQAQETEKSEFVADSR